MPRGLEGAAGLDAQRRRIGVRAKQAEATEGRRAFADDEPHERRITPNHVVSATRRYRPRVAFAELGETLRAQSSDDLRDGVVRRGRGVDETQHPAGGGEASLMQAGRRLGRR